MPHINDRSKPRLAALGGAVMLAGLLFAQAAPAQASAQATVNGWQITQSTSARCQSELKLYLQEGYRLSRSCYYTAGMWLAYVKR